MNSSEDASSEELEFKELKNIQLKYTYFLINLLQIVMISFCVD